jgi:MinD-like ATPase involved in chromosome partitioning or flagellar assembly
MGGNYTLGQVKNHADSATTLPANSLDPDAEWGPSFQDVRHRMNAMVNLPFFVGTRLNANVNAQSATPFTITTGIDDNLDGVVNDRPAGVGRNTMRGTARSGVVVVVAAVVPATAGLVAPAVPVAAHSRRVSRRNVARVAVRVAPEVRVAVAAIRSTTPDGSASSSGSAPTTSSIT